MSLISLVFMAWLIVLITISHRVVPRQSFLEPTIGTMSNLQEAAIDIFVAKTNFLTGLASLLLGAVGSLLLNRSPDGDGMPLSQYLLGLLAAALSLGAVYFGYEAYNEAIWMLEQQIVNLSYERMQFTTSIQFFFFLGAGFIFAILVGSSTKIKE